MWELPQDTLQPESIDIGELRFQEQLYDLIGLVEIAGKEGKTLVLKTISLDTKVLYHELKVLLTMIPHSNISCRPSYIVTKKVRFGGKRGACGFLMPYYPLGTVDTLLRTGIHPPPSLLLQWAKQLTEALIHFRLSPAKFYSDLNPRNIAIVESTGGALQLILIDYDQGTPGCTMAPPDIKYFTTIETLARSKTIGPDQQVYISLMHSLDPTWTHLILPSNIQKDF